MKDFLNRNIIFYIDGASLTLLLLNLQFSVKRFEQKIFNRPPKQHQISIEILMQWEWAT